LAHIPVRQCFLLLPTVLVYTTDLSVLQEWSPAVKVPLKERSTASNALKSVYELAWDCSMGLTGRGMRGELAVDVAVQDFGCVTVPILAKVYSSSDSSASHGELSQLTARHCDRPCTVLLQ
jgi:hypothetical protein